MQNASSLSSALFAGCYMPQHSYKSQYYADKLCKILDNFPIIIIIKFVAMSPKIEHSAPSPSVTFNKLLSKLNKSWIIMVTCWMKSYPIGRKSKIFGRFCCPRISNTKHYVIFKIYQCLNRKAFLVLLYYIKKYYENQYIILFLYTCS